MYNVQLNNNNCQTLINFDPSRESSSFRFFLIEENGLHEENGVPQGLQHELEALLGKVGASAVYWSRPARATSCGPKRMPYRPSPARCNKAEVSINISSLLRCFIGSDKIGVVPTGDIGASGVEASCGGDRTLCLVSVLPPLCMTKDMVHSVTH